MITFLYVIPQHKKQFVMKYYAGPWTGVDSLE
jgi:hypothetical protein